MIEIPEAVVLSDQINSALGGSIYYCPGCQAL